MSKFDPPGRRPRRLNADQIKADVLLGLAKGVPMTVIARGNDICTRTVGAWEQKDPSFAEELAEARALGWDHLAYECLRIADDRSGDLVIDEDGIARPNTANVLSRRLMIDTRLKLLARWDNGRYGDAKTVKLDGAVQITQRHTLDPSLLDEEGREALRRLLAHAQAQGLIEGPEPQDAEFEEVLGPEEDVADG